MWLFTKVIVIECIIIVIMNNSMTMNINAKIRETAILISKSQSLIRRPSFITKVTNLLNETSVRI